MKPECESAVRAAAGERQVTKGDLDAIEQRLHGASKTLRRADPAKWASMSPVERYKAAADIARSQHLETLTAGHARAIRRAQDKIQRDGVYDAVTPGKQVNAIIADTFTRFAKGTRTSLESRIEATRRWLATRLTGSEERMLDDPANHAALAKAFGNEPSGDPKIDAVAKKVQALQDAILERFRLAGVKVNHLENYRLPQPWAWDRVAEAGEAQWVQDMKGHLDLREFIEPDGSQMSPERIDQTLKAAYESIATNGANKRAEQESGFGGGSIQAKYAAPRQLHFKDGDSWMQAMQKYGESDHVGGILRSHWANMARDLAIAEHGMSDTDFARQVNRALTNDLKAAKTAKQARAAQRNAKWALDQWDVLTRGVAPGNAHAAAFMGAIRSVISSSKLGSLYSQQPSDALMAMNYLRTVGMTTKGFAADIASAIKGSGDSAAWGRSMGYWSDSIHNQTARFGDTEVYNRVSRFLNHTTYVASGMRALDRANTQAVGNSFFGTVGEHLFSGKSFGELPEASRELLARHGIDDAQWQVLQKAGLSQAPRDDRHFLNPADIQRIPPEQLRGLAEQRLSAVDAGLKARIQSLHDQTARESDWVAKRMGKLADLRKRAEETIAKLNAKAATQQGHAEGVAAARAELLRAKVERAEVEADIHRYLDTRDQQARISDAIDNVKDDEDVAPIIQKFALRVGTKGENIGALRAAAEAKIKDAETKLAEREQATNDAIDAKADAFDKRAHESDKELTAFTQEMHSRALRRQELEQAYRKEVGRQVQDEIDRLKNDTLTNTIGTFHDVLQAAGRGYSKSTITERHRLGLTKMEPGTIPGELMRMLTMIRQVPFGLAMTHYFDIPRGIGESWSADWRPRAAYMARFAIGQAVATGVMLQLKHLAYGEDFENPASWKFLGKALGGAFTGPMLATLLFGTGGEHHDAASDILGPGGEFLTEGVNLAQNVRDGLAGNPVNWNTTGSKALSLARSNMVPFGNMWYTKAAVNHMIYQQLQEAVSPGYNQRVQQRANGRGEVSKWWGQGDALPSRAPGVEQTQ